MKIAQHINLDIQSRRCLNVFALRQKLFKWQRGRRSSISMIEYWILTQLTDYGTSYITVTPFPVWPPELSCLTRLYFKKTQIYSKQLNIPFTSHVLITQVYVLDGNWNEWFLQGDRIAAKVDLEKKHLCEKTAFWGNNHHLRGRWTGC